jgi:hypothetical protein
MGRLLLAPRLIGRRKSPPSYVHTTGPAITTDLSEYTFSSVDISDAGNRIVVVGIMSLRSAAGTANLTSVTIAGVSASVEVVSASGGRQICAIATASVPTGTTGDIVVTFDQTMARCVIAVWAAYDLNSATAVDTASSTADPASLDVDTQTAGLIFAVAYNNGGGTATWTGITEQFDTTSEAALVTAADATVATGETPRTVECDYSSADTERVGVSASFR